MPINPRKLLWVALAGSGMSLVAASLSAQSPAPAEAPDVITYVCERGVTVDVVYADDIAVLHSEGRLVSLGQADSASGARYVERPDGTGYQWWGKGDEARLTHLDAPDGDEVDLYTRCIAQP